MWYDDNNTRWTLEQDSLRSSNIDFTIDEELKEKGLLRLTILITSDSDVQDIPIQYLPLKLIVVFPRLYPYFRPEIFAPNVDLPRHQNVVDKNLCLLPRSSVNWFPESTLAVFLKEQLPKVFAEGIITDLAVLESKEGEQAEPVSEYYPSFPSAPIIFDTTLFDNMKSDSSNVQFLGSVSVGIPPEATMPSRMFIIGSSGTNKELLYSAAPNLSKLFSTHAQGNVYRLKERPPFADPKRDYSWLVELFKMEKVTLEKLKTPIKLKGGFSLENIIGVSFPEEHLPGKLSWGWLFFVCGTSHPAKVNGKINKTGFSKFCYYAKVNRTGYDELSFRIPSLKPLSTKTVAIFGLGALGAPSVIEFAKNGIKEIRLIDFDTVNAGTTVRWPMGMTSVGMYKIDVLETFLNHNYPLVEVKKFNVRIGGNEVGIESDVIHELPTIDQILNGVSLIYDATAESGVSHLLSDEARRREIIYTSVYATPGVWGGVVMRYIPGVTQGCWMCLQYALKEGLIPSPPANRDGNIQAAGCGDISFTGTSFELDNIVSSGVRLAISSLCLNEKGYPNMNTDIGILSLIDDYGNPIFPKWTSHLLDKHSNCPYCNLE